MSQKRPFWPFCTLHRAPVGQGPSGPDWLAISFGFWSGRALATGTAWAGLCLIHHQPFGPFLGQSFPRQDGPPEKKVPLGIRLKSARRSHMRIFLHVTPHRGENPPRRRGCLEGGGVKG